MTTNKKKSLAINDRMERLRARAEELGLHTVWEISEPMLFVVGGVAYGSLDEAELVVDEMHRARENGESRPQPLPWDKVVHFIAQGAINITEGHTTIEQGSAVHRAMIQLCALINEGLVTAVVDGKPDYSRRTFSRRQK